MQCRNEWCWFLARIIIVFFFPHHTNGTFLSRAFDRCVHDILEIAFICYESPENLSQRQWEIAITSALSIFTASGNLLFSLQSSLWHLFPPATLVSWPTHLEELSASLGGQSVACTPILPTGDQKQHCIRPRLGLPPQPPHLRTKHGFKEKKDTLCFCFCGWNISSRNAW